MNRENFGFAAFALPIEMGVLFACASFEKI